MTVYRYKHRAPGHSLFCADELAVEQPWAAEALEACPECGRRVYRVIGHVRFQFRHGMKGDCRDYRDDLARFPNDPEAYVDGPRAVKKLLDKRLRQGWVRGPGWDVLHDTNQGCAVKETPEGGEALIRQCFEEARANNFSLNDPDVLDAFTERKPTDD